MCIKSIYYNTYGDGSQDVTERVDTCSPGEMCRRPEIREFRRQFRFTKLVEPEGSESSSSLADRKPTPYISADYHLRLPPTPRRSKSPSPNRKHKSAVYVNDEKVADIPSSRKRHSHVPSRSGRAGVILHAPEPPAPTRLTRSATLPAEYLPSEPPVRHRSRDIPVGPVHILEDLGRRRSSPSRREEHRDSHRSTSHYRRHVRGPEEAVMIDDEREQRERRRAARRSSTMYGRSSDFSSSSGAGATEAVYVAPAVAAAGKKLRWEDQVEAEIAAQNERISARPKLHQEVKGILKQTKGKDADVYDDLRRAVRGMDISSNNKDRTSPRRSDNGDYEYDRDRLRARFGDDPRERRRRSRVSYGAGMYDYQ